MALSVTTAVDLVESMVCKWIARTSLLLAGTMLRNSRSTNHKRVRPPSLPVCYSCVHMVKIGIIIDF